MDQAHEQNNALIKGDGGAIGLTENAAALRRWMVGGPEVSRVIEEFEAAVFECQEVSSHYEETPATQNAFTRDVSVLSDSIRKSGNPFQEETEDLLVLQSRDIIDPAITNSLFEVEAAGVHQYDEFVQQRLTTHTKPLYDPIKQNKFPRISSTVSKQTKPAQIATLKQDCNLFARLYIASQSRQGNLDEFFAHENQPYPPALSQFGRLRPTSKSLLLGCREDLAVQPDEMPYVDAVMLDGAAIVHMLPPKRLQAL